MIRGGRSRVGSGQGVLADGSLAAPAPAGPVECWEEVLMVASVADLETALAAGRVVLAGILSEQWSLPTPCPDWTVEELAAHLIGGNRMFGSIMRGDSALDPVGDVRTEADGMRGDWIGAYDQAADGLVRAFAADGAMARIVTVPFGTVPGAVALDLRITEVLVHGWDLARATGQVMRVSDAVVEEQIAFSRDALGRVATGRSPFGPPQPVPNDAPPLDRLAGLLGRSL